MHPKRFREWLCCGVAVFIVAGAASAQFDPNAYDVYKAGVPDVDKDPNNSPPADESCWMAAASNVLGGAGWGNADDIYQDMIDEFGTATGGAAAPAAKWWVHNVGLNKAMDGNGYNPTADYVDFRWIGRTLDDVYYLFLMSELDRCQYITVFWMKPDVVLGHYMTLVGGNVPGSPNGDSSVWHDSDSDAAGGGADEVHTNMWPQGLPNSNWRLDYPKTGENPNDDWLAEGAFLACPGVPKPADAIGNFDVHYFMGVGPLNPDPNINAYTTEPNMLTTGDNHGTYDAPHFNWAGNPTTYDPYWLNEADPNTPTVILPNEERSDLWKELYISVDFNEPINADDGNVPDIRVYYEGDDGNDVEVLMADWTWSPTDANNPQAGQILLKYVFDGFQPDWEKIVFPNDDYLTLTGDIFEWNIATRCVPEPATLVLVGAAVPVLLRRRRSRRRNPDSSGLALGALVAIRRRGRKAKSE